MARYIAPSREVIAAETFAQPVFDGFDADRDWLRGAQWPSVAALNAELAAQAQTHAPALSFVAQTPALLADGLHYEKRIAEFGRIATREQNWHDLLNAMIWLRHPALKRVLNQRQVQEIACVGAKQRSRAQCALTHFDEGGVIVVLNDPALLAIWDAHDWQGLFWQNRAAWGKNIHVVVFGHALLEHALSPGLLLLGKALAVMIDAKNRDGFGVAGLHRLDANAAIATIAQGIERGELLNDPQELRPLPLSGIQGWHADNNHADFYRDAPCFRPLRDGRIYPPPTRI
ncbi:DUF3025 domain-containing protein [Pseudolysobacter antarcticus]|uniref:DUF3025 domain-containing protein n=1 Tax=Pseudolysobacter antarcticus TaxID=2511995 RepID=A0A411HLL5_9GAMM|nr:DUF3025 domain-containing protein [Pseudolysobacter antarcticus]QBB71393.1 DUF3025 domain-containing protein [Pseudolysobacter antarcticus]